MSRSAWWNPRLGPLSLCALMGVIHVLLGAVLAEHDIVSCIFAAGEHVPAWMVMLTGMFAAIRLFVIVIAPGLLAWRLALGAAEAIFRSKKKLCMRS